LNPLTRHLFPEADDAVLTYLDDDGTPVEPEFYVPILPFVLFNGISGIGTGFSCNIPAYSPKQVVRYLRNKLMQPAQEEEDFLPYYEGFTGTVQRVAEKKFLVKGKYVVLGEDKIRITELPVGTWTMPYIAFLESLMDGIVDAKTGKKSPPVIRDFTSMCTELVVDITVVFPKGKLTELEGVVGGSTVSLDGSNHGSNHAINGVEKLLKLSTTVSNTNMHLFDQDKRLHKYDSVQEIIAAFVPVRMATYAKRKAALVADLEYRLKKLSGKAKFILATLEGTIDLRKKSAVEVETLLLQHGFDPIDGDFKYLVKMSMDSVTAEHVQRILKEKADAEQNLLALLGTTLETMWLQELDAFEREYDAYTVSKHQGIHSGTKSKRVVSSTTEQHPSKRPKKTHTK